MLTGSTWSGQPSSLKPGLTATGPLSRERSLTAGLKETLSRRSLFRASGYASAAAIGAVIARFLSGGGPSSRTNILWDSPSGEIECYRIPEWNPRAYAAGARWVYIPREIYEALPS